MAERAEVSPLDISVVRGDPSLDELAVLVAVLQTRAADPPAAPGPPAGSARTTSTTRFGGTHPSARTLPSAATAPSAAGPSATPSAWATPASLHRRPLPLPSPTAWRRPPV